MVREGAEAQPAGRGVGGAAAGSATVTESVKRSDHGAGPEHAWTAPRAA
jgi:hypothetical protein